MPAISKRAKRVLITLAALVVLAILWVQFVGLYVDWSWFREVGFSQVFSTRLITRLVLFLIIGVVSAGVVFASLLMGYRTRPVFVPTNTVDPLSPYRALVTRRPKLFAIGLSVVIGLICGLSAQGQWSTVQLWMNRQTFGTIDPQFHHDVGFYVFILPMIQLVMSWLFVLTAVAFVVVLVTQYLFGGVRLSGPGRRISSAAVLQLSLLVGAFVLVKAVQYWFDRYGLLFSNRNGKFTGASYTDINAVLPAKIILLCIAAICAVGFVVGAFLRSVKLPAIALALLVLSSVLIGGVWPLILQQVVVNPNAITKEPLYISRNIDATREAYGIGPEKIKTITYADSTSGSSPASVPGGDQAVANARLLDPNILSATFTQNQQLKNFFGFSDPLSVDRYTIDGKTQDYVVAARELKTSALSGEQTNWIQQHTIYTHGDGFVMAPANAVTNGYPQFSVSDLANKGLLKVDQPRVYYGGLVTTYAIVGSPDPGNKNLQREYDTDTTKYTYTGKGGVPVGNLFDRLVFATKYAEPNFLFSGEINSASKIMYNRDPRERVQLAAPFLTVDTSPYPAVVDGRIVWIVDGYTTAANYPYAQDVDLSDLTTNSQTVTGNAQSQATQQISYVRNSVKATVDAYDGTVTLYSVSDDDKGMPTDPMLRAWEGVFPGLVKPAADISAELRSHFRYPQDLFEIQRQLLTKYHVDSPTDFYANSNFWDVPNDPTESAAKAAQPPYYQLMALPGKADTTEWGSPRFQLTSALTVYDRQYMAAFLAADSDPANYGQLTVMQLPENNTQTPGPVLVQQAFRTDSRIAQYVTTRQASGSTLVYGNLLTIPTNGGLLYIEPIYIVGGGASPYPQLGQVLVWYGKRVGLGDTLSEALAAAAASAPTEIPTTPPPGSENPSTPGTTGSAGAGVTVTNPSSPTTSVQLPASAEQALKDMQAAAKNLDEAKKSGDLGRIGAATQALEDAVNHYLQLAAPTSTSSTGTGTSAPATSSTGG